MIPAHDVVFDELRQPRETLLEQNLGVVLDVNQIDVRHRNDV
jgi:hypothetical protein